MSRAAYKRSRLRDITGRWATGSGSTPGHQEKFYDVADPEKRWLGSNDLVVHARRRTSTHNAHKNPRVTPNTRRGVTGGAARFMRGRRRVIDRHDH